jgi:hypothetical protein
MLTTSNQHRGIGEMPAGRRLGNVVLLAAAAWGACALPGNAARAATGAGQAVIVVSTVQGILGQQTRELVVKDNVYSQELIETGPDSATRMVFRDGTELSMGPSSRVTLDRYIYDPENGESGQLVMNVIGGVFEFASGGIPHEGYDIRTPFATIAVRGTRLGIISLPNKQFIESREGLVMVQLPGQAAPIPLDQECLNVVPTGHDVAPLGDQCDLLAAELTLMNTVLAQVEPAAGPAVDEDDEGLTDHSNGITFNPPPASGQ